MRYIDELQVTEWLAYSMDFVNNLWLEDFSPSTGRAVYGSDVEAGQTGRIAPPTNLYRGILEIENRYVIELLFIGALALA